MIRLWTSLAQLTDSAASLAPGGECLCDLLLLVLPDRNLRDEPPPGEDIVQPSGDLAFMPHLTCAEGRISSVPASDADWILHSRIDLRCKVARGSGPKSFLSERNGAVRLLGLLTALPDSRGTLCNVVEIRQLDFCPWRDSFGRLRSVDQFRECGPDESNLPFSTWFALLEVSSR